jgi:hypothetical protein
MNRKPIISLRTYAEMERERSRKSLAERVAWLFLVAAAAYFAAHLVVAVARG